MRTGALDDPALDVLHRVADEVAQRLAATSEWGFSGRRDGQYSVDLDVDEGAVEILIDAGFAVLSEESGRSGDGDRVVVLDPLDGSTNASRGIPWFATSLCVVDDDGPVVALVANQATGERLAAVRGQGAWIGSRRLAASGATTLDGTVVGLNSLPDEPWGWWQSRALRRVCARSWTGRRGFTRRLHRSLYRSRRTVGLPRRRAPRAGVRGSGRRRVRP